MQLIISYFFYKLRNKLHPVFKHTLAFRLVVMYFVRENCSDYVCSAYSSHVRNRHSYPLSIDLLNRSYLRPTDPNICKINQPIFVVLFFLFDFDKREKNDNCSFVCIEIQRSIEINKYHSIFNGTANFKLS